MTASDRPPAELAIDEACADYDRVLERVETETPGFCQALLDRLVAERASYAARPICPFLRPNFVTQSQTEYVERVLGLFRSAVVKAKDAMLADPALFALAGLTDGERRLFDIDPGFRHIGITTRIDTFLIGTQMRFVELNAECPAGMHYGETLARVFLDTPVMADFQTRFRLSRPNPADLLLQSLLATWAEWGGQGSPRVAVVDWKEVSTRTEFDLVCEHFQGAGLEAEFADPRDLEFSGGRLRSGGKPIDVVYRRLLTNELLARESECRALVTALEQRAVCLFNSFRAKLLHKKTLFAILQDPRIMTLLSPDEAAVIHDCVPWTRLVREGKTDGPTGETIDLIEWARDHREDLVLKPNDEYGGRGVVVGHNVEQDVWERALAVGLADLSIVQQRVAVPTRDFPVLDEGRLAWSRRYVDFDPYLFRGRVGGYLTRLSASSLCNVTAGGGTTPTFVLDGC